ncbi:hypothetical protein BDY19DRAFT_928213 [Irpex rosettiformis]|uniref:Uncharacterized protein n=1 Tax=Irpex rosettiformis TaxID=378272 RepID=A0ACB8UCU4_9APHY|nr:hypothetical protein BDY19DRAFT_928213 [Irpex rosettiformis]
MPMHLPFTPNHIQLISACYPPNAALLTAGPDYRPNSQELSRMTYYASNKSGKINKLASELERRVKTDSRKAKGGNIRARASLLITLAIIKALAIECRRDLALLTGSLLASVSVTLSALSSDLEVAARAGSVFTAWTTYTDGHLIEVDQHVAQDYMSCLQIFSLMGRIETPDREVTSRTRLVGLAALTSVVTSEVLYNSTTQLKMQISTLIPALLIPLLDEDVIQLEQEAGKVKEQPTTAHMSEFRNRPAMERRAASIHIHVAGEDGPTSREVANAAIRALSHLFGHSNGGQAAISIQAAIDCFNDANTWDKTEHCSWVAVHAAEWTQYQYRYAIPTRLVECLMQDQDTSKNVSRPQALAAMITAVFNSPIPLVNLSTSDIISSLITVALRRTSKDPEDALLPAIVRSVSSLGTHVYYAEQIQDLAGELISRLVAVETTGLLAGVKCDNNKTRVQAIRCLLAGLLGLIHSAEVHDVTDAEGQKSGPSSPVLGRSADYGTAEHKAGAKAPRRRNVAPDVWQDTVSLLCDSDYSVRADYSATLVSYFEREIPKLWDVTDTDGVKRIRPLAEEPVQQANVHYAVLHGDNTTRLLNSIHAHLYVLATSSNLGFPSVNTAPSSRHSVNGDIAPSTVVTDESNTQDLTDPLPQIRRSLAIPRTRKLSVMQRLLQHVPSKLSASTPASATLSDYGNILAVLTTVFTRLPVRGLLTGVPMLLALNSTIQVEESDVVTPRIAAVRELLASSWTTLAKVWECPELLDVISKGTPSGVENKLPLLSTLEAGEFGPQQNFVPLPVGPETVSVEKAYALLDQEALMLAIVSNKTIQDATGMDRQGLLRKFSASWSAESAFREAIDATSTNADLCRADALAPLVKVPPAFMHIDNLSRASLARSTRGVGVTDLREALEGRSSLSNPNLRETAGSISTFDHTSATHGDALKLTPVRSRTSQRGKIGGPGDVKDVLNKLGIGKTNGVGMLRPSFAMKKSEQRSTSTVVPPYKT